DEDWLAYCRRDVDITQEAVVRLLTLVEDEDLGNLRLTVAGQGRSWWRHRHLSEKVKTPEHPEDREFERAAYFGARQECSFIGAVLHPRAAGLERMFGAAEGQPFILTGPVYRLDLVSAYPAIMAEERFPVELVARPTAMLPADLLRAMAALGAVADVSLETPN